jgi:hypothetical protein
MQAFLDKSTVITTIFAKDRGWFHYEECYRFTLRLKSTLILDAVINEGDNEISTPSHQHPIGVNESAGITFN